MKYVKAYFRAWLDMLVLFGPILLFLSFKEKGFSPFQFYLVYVTAFAAVAGPIRLMIN